MKKIAFFGVILVLLAASAVPVLARSPGNNNGNAGDEGNALSQTVAQRAQQHEEHQVQDRNQEQGTQHAQNNNQNQFTESNGMGNGNQMQLSRRRTPIYLQGTITAIDPSMQTVTVNLTHGNAQLKASIGMTLTLQADDSTQIYKIIQGHDDHKTGTSMGIAKSTRQNNGEQGTGNRLAITFDQLLVNDIVAIHGDLVEGVYQATLVTVYVPMSVGAPTGAQP